MWGSLVTGLINLLGSWLGLRRDVATRNNSPEIKANEVAKADAKAADEIQATVAKAAAGDRKSLEDLRREAAE